MAYGNEGPRKEPVARRKLMDGEIDRRIEMVRQMIIFNFSDWDIKKECARLWSKENEKFGKPAYKQRSIEKYITRARQINRSSTDASADDNLAASIGYWGRKQRAAETDIEREGKAVAAAEAAYQAAKKEIQDFEFLPKAERDAKETLERMEILEIRKGTALARIVDGKKTMIVAEQRSKECQREIDRLKGTHAPIKHATTKADGTDVERMTEAEIEEALLRMGHRMPPKLLTGEAAAVEQIIPDDPVIDAEFEPAAKVKPSKNGHATNGHANGHSPHVPPFVSSVLNGHATNGHAPAPAKEVDDGEQAPLTLDDFFDI